MYDAAARGPRIWMKSAQFRGALYDYEIPFSVHAQPEDTRWNSFISIFSPFRNPV